MSEISKTEAVRRLLAEDANAKPKALATLAKSRFGVTVTEQYAANLKSAWKRERQKARFTPEFAASFSALTANEVRQMVKPDAVQVADLLAAKQFADRVGGLEAAKRCVETLATLRA